MAMNEAIALINKDITIAKVILFSGNINNICRRQVREPNTA